MDKDYYLNEIKVNEWLINDKNQLIRFKDRIEYRIDGILDRNDGPAIEYFDEKKENEYYTQGKKII
jgi:hypothetical protein